MFSLKSWFVGILEGEGWFCNTTKRIGIQINDKDLINKCEEFLQQNYILYTSYTAKVGGKNGYRIYIYQPDTYNLYTLINFKMECRKKEFQQILNKEQNESSITLDSSWLIGIWEAEGSFYFIKNTNEVLVPRIGLNNCNFNIIEKIKINLKNLNCAFHVQDYKELSKKPRTHIDISGILRCNKFLINTMNLWQSSRNILRSNLMLEYINSRLSKNQNEPYNHRELEIYKEIKNLNH